MSKTDNAEFYCEDCAHCMPDRYGEPHCRRSMHTSEVTGKPEYELAQSVRRYKLIYPDTCAYAPKSTTVTITKFARPVGFKQILQAIFGRTTTTTEEITDAETARA